MGKKLYVGNLSYDVDSSALQELFLRFSEDGKLNKEKSQFQAKLAEYEKYAALTQLALGAASNPPSR